MPENISQHQDLISIVIEGEGAKVTLEELRALFVSLQEAAVATGVQVDQAMGRLVTPLRAIAENTGMAVRELQALRLALTGVGGAAAGPAQAAAGLRQIAAAARDAQAGLMGMPAYGFRPTGQLVSGIAPAGMEQPGVPVTRYGRYGGEAVPSAHEVQRVEELAASFDKAAESQGRFAMSQEQLAVAADPQVIAQTMREQIALAQAMGDPTAVRQATQNYDDFVRAQGRVQTGFEQGEKAVGRFSGSFRRHIIWFAQGTVIYYAMFGAIQAVSGQISGMVDDILAYDQAMARMRFITQESTADLGRLADEAQRIGVVYGQMPTEVLPGLVEITQATKDYSEQLQYSTDAAKWAFMSGQEYSDGLEQLISVQRVWGLEASEGQQVLDAVATSYRVAMIPMDEMMATLERGGRIAESVGLSFNEYAATIAAVGEYSDLTASQVTTLMERISARPFQPELARRFRREFGFLNIELFEPGTAMTQRRAVADIMDDLVRNWGRLTTAQRQSVAEIMAGSRQASEFLTLMEAWSHVSDYVEDYNDNLGESNRLTGELMNTITAQKESAVAAFRDLRHEAGQFLSDLLGIPDALLGIAVRFEALAGLAREARGQRAEPLTREESIRAQIEATERQLAQLRGERGPLEQFLAGLQRRPLGGGVVVPVQFEERVLEGEIEGLRQRLAEITPPITVGVGIDLMGEYKNALAETAQVQQGMITAEQVFLDLLAEVQATGMMPLGIDEWLMGLDAVTSSLDLTEYSHQQINQAQIESIALAQMLYQVYLDQAEALKGSELTTLEIKAIAEATLFSWADSVRLIQDAAGQYRIIRGLGAAFLQDTIRQYQAERARFDIRRLQEVQPEQFGGLQQMAWQWQAYLQQLPGYDEEVQQFWVILADNVARPIVTTATALRYAIEDLTEVEKQQLEGMWNLPAGATAYVPITSLFYARQREGAEGPPGAVPMAGPPTGIAGGAPSAPQIGTAVADANIARFTPLTREMMAELERIFAQPWDLQEALASLAQWQAGTYAPETLYTPVTPEMFTEMDLVFAQMQSLFDTYRSAFEPGLAIIRSITGEGAWPGITGRAGAALEQPPQRFEAWPGERPTDPLGLAGILGAAITPLITALAGLSSRMTGAAVPYTPMQPGGVEGLDELFKADWNLDDAIESVREWGMKADIASAQYGIASDSAVGLADDLRTAAGLASSFGTVLPIWQLTVFSTVIDLATKALTDFLLMGPVYGGEPQAGGGVAEPERLYTPAPPAEPERLYTPATPEKLAETSRILSEPWDLQRMVGSMQTAVGTMQTAMESARPQQVTVNIPPVMADITMTSYLQLDGAIIARMIQREVGRRLSHASRGYGLTGGGNAPRMMI